MPYRFDYGLSGGVMVHQITGMVLVLVIAVAAGMAGGCSRSSEVPSGWKIATDPSGSCQVATPADWQSGRDFFLAQEKADTGPKGRGAQRLPPMGFALWGIDVHNREKVAQIPQGKRFQLRTALEHGESVCSVWRIKKSSDFTAEEKETMQKVGKTLKWVR